MDIDLSGNAISTVEPFTFERMRELQSVDLTDNLIETIYKDALRVRTPRGTLKLSYKGLSKSSNVDLAAA